jgi:hypothetical protein
MIVYLGDKLQKSSEFKVDINVQVILSYSCLKDIGERVNGHECNESIE